MMEEQVENIEILDVDENTALYIPNYSFNKPFLCLNYADEFMNSKSSKSNYTQGCKWSPDGTIFQVVSDDKTVRIFNLPPNVARGEFNDENWMTKGWREDIKPAIVVKEKENIYDYQWYPKCVQMIQTRVVTCREMPIHLWDVQTGQFICSYLYFDHLEQLAAAYSLGFSTDGLKLVGGYAKGIQIFDVERYGRYSSAISTQGQSGIISCLDFHPELPNIFAAGSYGGSVGIYSLETKRGMAIFEGHAKGVTHLQFTQDGTKLFSGTRKDDEIVCWDIRNPGTVLAVLKRRTTTNQRMYFDTTLNDQYLLSGSTDGDVLFWDVEASLTAASEDSGKEVHPSGSFKAHEDCVNGISVHPSLPLLITSSGQRIVPDVKEENSDS